MSDSIVSSDLKIFHHLEVIKSLKEGKRPNPVYLRIKPTNICNQRCFFCAYADNAIFDDRSTKRDSIDWQLLKGVLNDFKDLGGKAVTYSGGGEPLCYHSIKQALLLTKELGLDLSIITNGQALKDEILEYLADSKWVRISFDAANTETYKKIRNVGTYESVLNNIKDFAKKKSNNCVLGINCVITESNYMEVFDLCRLLKDSGVNNVKLSPVLLKKDTPKYHERIRHVVMDQVERIKNQLVDDTFCLIDKYSNDYALESDYVKPYNKCYVHQFFAVIGADAKVYRCHQKAYTESGVIGDLKEKSFSAIWNGLPCLAEDSFDPKKACGFRCAFDERNRILDEFFNMNMDHVNFV